MGSDLFKPMRHAALMRRFGPFIFLSGVMGLDPVTGKVIGGLGELPADVRKQLASGDIHQDSVEGPILAQSWLTYQNMDRMLKSVGSSLDNLLHAIVFLRNIRETWVAFNRVRKMLVKNPPPSTAIEMPRLGVDDAVLLQIHVIAGIPDEHEKILAVELPKDGELARPRLYGAGVKRMDPLLFAMGTGGVEPKTRKIIMGLEDLPEEARKALSTGDARRDAAEGKILAQTWVGYQNVKRYFEDAGASLGNVVQENIILRNVRENLGPVERVRRTVLGQPSPATIVETPRLGITDELLIEIHAIGAATDTGTKIESFPAAFETPGAVMRKAGPFVFLTGMASLDFQTGKPIGGLADLPVDVQSRLTTGDMFRDALEGPVAAQAWVAYNNIKKYLEKAGASMENILDEIIFMKNTREGWGPLDRVRRMLIKNPGPNTVIETRQLSVSSDLLLEVHIIAGIPDGR